MKTFLYVVNPNGNLDIVELDLADMVTLVDWYQSNENKVFSEIMEIGELQVPSSILSSRIEHKNFEDDLRFYEELAYTYKGYFVNLKDWNQKPPKKAQKQTGDIFKLIFISYDFMEKKPWSLEFRGSIYVKDKSKKYVHQVYDNFKNNRYSKNNLKLEYELEESFLDRLESMSQSDEFFFIYLEIEEEDLRNSLKKRPSLYKEIM